MITCSWKQEFGIECMMCGFQRAFALLFKGEFVESLLLFPALIPLLLTFLLLFVHLIFKLKYGARLITVLFSVSALIILVAFISKIDYLA